MHFLFVNLGIVTRLSRAEAEHDLYVPCPMCSFVEPTFVLVSPTAAHPECWILAQGC